MTQLALFDERPAAGPDGLRYVGDFVSTEAERELIAHIAKLPLKPFQFGAFEGLRQVKSFGFRLHGAEAHRERSNPRLAADDRA